MIPLWCIVLLLFIRESMTICLQNSPQPLAQNLKTRTPKPQPQIINPNLQRRIRNRTNRLTDSYY